MKKYIFLFILVFLSVGNLFSQTYNAVLSIDTIYLKGVKIGDEITVPIRLNYKSGGQIIGFQFFIEFDHSLFTWKGTSKNPLDGVNRINNKMPYNSADWLFNDNGNQMVALWLPTDSKVDMNKGELFFEYIFVYNGGNCNGTKCLFYWGMKNEQKDGKIVRGKTEMYSEEMDLFDLSLNNGIIIENE